jgi:hypothetical protein
MSSIVFVRSTLLLAALGLLYGDRAERLSRMSGEIDRGVIRSNKILSVLDNQNRNVDFSPAPRARAILDESIGAQNASFNENYLDESRAFSAICRI